MRACRQCGGPVVGHFNTRFCGNDCRQTFKRAYMETWKASHPRTPKEARPNPIPPFPAEIDREAFGSWLSGFADGEATFALRVLRDKRRDHFHCTAHLRITLRDDDAETLGLIRSYWDCGRLYSSDNIRSKTPNAKPVTIYAVQSVSDLAKVVLPHFDRHPLRAKKRHDLAIWRQGVELMARAQSRPHVVRPGKGGFEPRWTDAEKERFRSLEMTLRNQRRYVDGSASAGATSRKLDITLPFDDVD